MNAFRWTAIALVTPLLLAACLPDLDPDDSPDAGAAAEDDAGSDAGAALDASTQYDAATGATCPDSFTACGGDLVGGWTILAFCPAAGGSLTNPCEHPWDTLPECNAPPNQALCTLHYSGDIVFEEGGDAVVDTGVAFEMEITLTAECALADDRCGCYAMSPPETETITDVYVIEDDTVVIGPDRGEPIGGPYCVEDDTLVIQGPIGWEYWVLERAH